MEIEVNVIVALLVELFHKGEMYLNGVQKLFLVLSLVLKGDLCLELVRRSDLLLPHIGRISDDNIKATFVTEDFGKIDVPNKGLLFWGLKAIFNIDETLNLFIN